MGEGGAGTLVEQGERACESLVSYELETPELVDDEQALASVVVGAGGDEVEMGIHLHYRIVGDFPSQLHLRALAVRVERSLGLRQVAPAGEGNALALRQEQVVDAELLEPVGVAVF